MSIDKNKSGRRQWMINSVSPSSSRPQAYSTPSDILSINDRNNSLGASFSVSKDEPRSCENCICAREDNSAMPSEDDIEKSIYVNEDGSVTVEMKVHLCIKEEEIIEWTTTISASGVHDGKSNGCNSNLESTVNTRDFVHAQSHYQSERMQFENLGTEEVFDDPCTAPTFSIDAEIEKKGNYDIWQNNFSNTEEHLDSAVEPFLYKGNPRFRSVKQGVVSGKSLTAKCDTQNSGKIIQFPNQEETGFSEFGMKHNNELFSIPIEKKTFKIIRDAASDDLSAKINVNTQGKEKTIQEKSTSFVGKDSSSRSSQQFFDGQLDASKMINSVNKRTSGANDLSEYLVRNRCVDSEINFERLYSRPSSGDPTYTMSKQRKIDRRPMSASFQYSRASMPVYHETSTLSTGVIYSHTSTETKQIRDGNISCTYSSGLCEARMSIFLKNVSILSMCLLNSNARYQNCTEIDNEVKLPMNADSNDSSYSNDEGVFCKIEDSSRAISDLDKQNSRKDSSGNTNLHPEYDSSSPPSQLLCRHDNNDVFSDNCTIPNGGHELAEVIDMTIECESIESNTIEMSIESKETFCIGSGYDGSISHYLTDLISAKEIINCNPSQVPVACSSDKIINSPESPENRQKGMEDQHFITICSSNVISLMPEKVFTTNIFQDIISKHEDTTLLISYTKQLNQCPEEDQCNSITTKDAFKLNPSPMIKFDSESTLTVDLQIARANGSSNESAIQLCSFKPIRKKWKHVAKSSSKILNIPAVKEDAQNTVLFSTLIKQNQELRKMDIPSSQNLEQNMVRSISPTSDLMHYEKNLGSSPSTLFAKERANNNSTSNIIKETNNLCDNNYETNDLFERNGTETNDTMKHKFKQIVETIICNVRKMHKVAEDCRHDYLLQSQLDVVQREIKHAPISNESGCQFVTEVIKMESNISELKKETNEIAIQVDTGVLSETADDGNSIEEQDLRQVLCLLQSTVDKFKNISHHGQKLHPKKTYGMPDVLENLATTLSTSSKVLLAWLAIINLNISVPPDAESALMANCSCSEVLTFLELVRNVVNFQKTNDSKQHISELQKCVSQLVKLPTNEESTKEESTYVYCNDPKNECSLQTETSADKQSALSSPPQLSCFFDKENYLDIHNIIEQLCANETRSEVNKNISTHPNEEGINEAVKEIGSKDFGLLSFKDNLISAHILEDQLTSDSICQNESTLENTMAKNKEWSDKKVTILQQHELLKTETIIEYREVIGNKMQNNENGDPACPRAIEANDQFTYGNVTASPDEMLAVLDTMHPQTKISLPKFMDHESLMANAKSEPKHGNNFCQGDHMGKINSSEIHVRKLPASVFVLFNSEIENKPEGKQQANKTSENLYFEGKAENMELLPCRCPSVPSNHDVKQSLQRQQTYDLSEGDQTSINSIASDYNSQASNEMTTEGEEDTFEKSKHFSANFVRKATEKLYGKLHVGSKHHTCDQSPSCNDKSRVGITCSVKNEPLNTSGLEKGQTFKSSQNTNSHSEEEGVLIEKGRWLLKENHLIRKSPPLNLGMYGTLDATSVDTTCDNTSDDTAHQHVSAVHLAPPLSELSSSEIEEIVKPGTTCNYFSMPHASDSEPFPDQISLKSKQGLAYSGSNLTVKKESGKQLARTFVHSAQLTSVDDCDLPFASVGFHMFDNKVSPLAQPLPDGTIAGQGPVDIASRNRNIQNPDSLDKFHLLCGQNCPILTAIIESSNEESRRFVYQKQSDPENQWAPSLDNAENSYTFRKYNGLLTESRTCTGLIDSIISDMHKWFKTPSIHNDISGVKLSLNAKYLAADNELLKPLLHTDNTEFKPLLSNVIFEAKKKYIKNIVKQRFMKEKMQNNMKAIKERINGLLVQAQDVEDTSSRQTDPYLLGGRMSTANNNITIPLLENDIRHLVMPSENVNRNDVAMNSEKEQFCDSHKPNHSNTSNKRKD